MRVDGAFCRSDIRASPPPPRRGWMAPPRRVLAALLLGAAAPAAAFQPARVSSQHRHSVAVCSTIDNRRRRSRSDNEASEGLGIVNVPVTEDAIKMAKDKLEGRPARSPPPRRPPPSPPPPRHLMRFPTSAASTRGRPSPEFVLFIVEILSKFVSHSSLESGSYLTLVCPGGVRFPWGSYVRDRFCYKSECQVNTPSSTSGSSA